MFYTLFHVEDDVKGGFAAPFDMWLASIRMKCPPADLQLWTLIPSSSAGGLVWLHGKIPAVVYLKKLSGWWKHVMKWCDISSLDELTAKLWPDAMSPLLTGSVIDSWDMQPLINGAHWQRGTLGDHFTGDMCQQFCLENDTPDAFICTKCERASL